MPASGLVLHDFNPRAPRGARQPLSQVIDWKISGFQSTCPARGTTRLTLPWFRGYNISIHVPREGHDVAKNTRQRRAEISIHVPREGHDLRRQHGAHRSRISIHVPREGHDCCGSMETVSSSPFQSTCPARGTTGTSTARSCRRCYFNPRAPRGARQQTCTIFSCRFAQELQISR